MLEVQLPGKLKRGKPNVIVYLDVMKEKMRDVRAREDDVFD